MVPYFRKRFITVDIKIMQIVMKTRLNGTSDITSFNIVVSKMDHVKSSTEPLFTPALIKQSRLNLFSDESLGLVKEELAGCLQTCLSPI